ncbi:RNA methyltransferase [Microcoleus sp. FACHB-1515]|uniref:TrmH family RNA methyltransferase n=1 Tax=Cyanophyceae TaxID=3028117 RepID=UPI0016875350|nr:RNA methyltransferase [Microcoleus sp. FACHB-1515]MBD2090734.1 RNA methyltransferase [Microcoleus sp. FACHB-1515]
MLTSLQNPLIKQLRKLQKAKERHEQQLSLLEGTHLIEEAIATDRSLATLCCTESWQRQHLALYERAINRCDRAEIVSPEVLAAIATTVNPDGVVATIDRLLPIEPPTDPKLGVLLDTLQDPGNLGTIIRTAAAANVDGLWLSGNSVDLDHPKVLRASAGQWFRLPMAESDDLPTLIEQQKRQGVQIVATLPNADRLYWQADLRSPTLLLLGNEGAGLSPELAAMADLAVSIPLARNVESLNVAIACALILYEAQRQRQS